MAPLSAFDITWQVALIASHVLAGTANTVVLLLFNVE
jgi:hypothetical protein